MFTGAREIQNWLTNTAKEIARSKPLAVVEALEDELTSARGDMGHAAAAAGGASAVDNPKRSKSILRRLNKRIRQGETLVVWVTPLGLPIVQPYRRRNVKQVTGHHARGGEGGWVGETRGKTRAGGACGTCAG